MEKNLASSIQGPHLWTPNPGFNPWFTPGICYINGGMNPGLNPGFGVLRFGSEQSWTKRYVCTVPSGVLLLFPTEKVLFFTGL
jgi:hypothetical protein